MKSQDGAARQTVLALNDKAELISLISPMNPVSPIEMTTGSIDCSPSLTCGIRCCFSSSTSAGMAVQLVVGDSRCAVEGIQQSVDTLEQGTGRSKEMTLPGFTSLMFGAGRGGWVYAPTPEYGNELEEGQELGGSAAVCGDMGGGRDGM